MNIFELSVVRVVGLFCLEAFGFYYQLGMRWKWDSFDLWVLAVVLVALVPCVWRDSRRLHEAFVVAPRERGWARERAARRARRAAAQDYLRHHHER
jgi:hypothetical protein